MSHDYSSVHILLLYQVIVATASQLLSKTRLKKRPDNMKLFLSREPTYRSPPLMICKFRCTSSAEWAFPHCVTKFLIENLWVFHHQITKIMHRFCEHLSFCLAHYHVNWINSEAKQPVFHIQLPSPPAEQFSLWTHDNMVNEPPVTTEMPLELNYKNDLHRNDFNPVSF